MPGCRPSRSRARAAEDRHKGGRPLRFMRLTAFRTKSIGNWAGCIGKERQTVTKSQKKFPIFICQKSLTKFGYYAKIHICVAMVRGLRIRSHEMEKSLVVPGLFPQNIMRRKEEHNAHF